MAGIVFFSVMVLCTLHRVFAIDCVSVDLDSIMNCNDCFRCGGYWCNNPLDKNDVHCSSQLYENWCPGNGNLEKPPQIVEESIPGVALNPGLFSVTAKVDQPSVTVPFKYSVESSLIPEVHVSVINTTQTDKIKVIEKSTVCENGKCSSRVSVQPETNFCLPGSGKYEFVNMRVRVDNLTEEAVVKYHVPCACACSDIVDKNAAVCNTHGDLSCGVCSCHKGWSGAFCENKELPICDHRRGDVQCANPYKSDVECSGNGYCGPCDTCICYDDKEGSQYFQEDNFCADLCLIVASECELCLLERPLGECPECPNLTVQAMNKTLLLERDEYSRKVWVECMEVIDGCEQHYVAMRDANHDIVVMKEPSCNAIAGAIAGGNINIMLPTVLGILAIVAAVAAAGGYLVWKARSAPIQPTSSQYRELDAPEGSEGINPLYKPPTSSYNNPMWKGAHV